MAVVDRATAQAAAELVRDETGTGLNTAARVGNTFLDLSDSLLFGNDGSSTGHLPVWDAALTPPRYAAGRTLTGDYTITNSLSIGASPATTGDARFGDNTGIYWKNGAANIRGIAVASGDLFIGDAGATGPTVTSYYAATTHNVNVNGLLQLQITETTIDAQNNNIVTTGALSLGAAPATGGALRLTNATDIAWNLGGTPITALQVDGSGNFNVGRAGANGTTANIYDVKTGGVHLFQVNSVSQLNLSDTAADFQDNDLLTTGFAALSGATSYVSIGESPSTQGDIRGDAAFSVWGRWDPGGGAVDRHILSTQSGQLVIGDGAEFTSVVSGASVGHLWKIGVTDQMSLSTDGIWLASGLTVDFGLSAALGGGSAATLSTIGGSGPATATQWGWVEVKVEGVTTWLAGWR